MKQIFTLIVCLTTFAALQADPSWGCGCKKKRRSSRNMVEYVQFSSCGCDVGSSSDKDLPSSSEE